MWNFKLILIFVTILVQIGSLFSATDILSQDGMTRVVSGFSAGNLLPKCYVTLQVQFPQSGINRKCGGCILTSTKILTSGNCVTSPQDGTSDTITFTVGNTNSKNGRRGFGVSQVNLAPGYDYTVRNSLNDLAVLTLNKSLPLSNSIKPPIPDTTSDQDAYVGKNLLACGFGGLDNDIKYPNGAQCTYLNVVAADICLNAVPDSRRRRKKRQSQTLPIICTQNRRDSNACVGDEGAPVFINATGTWKLAGIISRFPDQRKNAPCQDGHMVQITQIGGLASSLTTGF